MVETIIRILGITQVHGAVVMIMIMTIIVIAAMIIVMTSVIVIFKVANCDLEHFPLDNLRISRNMLIFAADNNN